MLYYVFLVLKVQQILTVADEQVYMLKQLPMMIIIQGGAVHRPGLRFRPGSFIALTQVNEIPGALS